MKPFSRLNRTTQRTVLLFSVATSMCLLIASGCGNNGGETDNTVAQAGGTGNPNAPAIVQQQTAQQQEMAKRQAEIMQKSSSGQAK